MTRRDLFWRGVGAALFVGAPCLVPLAATDGEGAHTALTMFCMAMMIFGLVLLVQGKKVALAWRVESSPHRMLPAMIRSRRRERRMRRRP